MGLKTDFMSLGAIGFGTAVAVVGTGGLLIAGAVHEFRDDVAVDAREASCVAVSISELVEAPEAPARAPRVAKIELVEGDVKVDFGDIHELGEAPVDVDVDVRVDCVAGIERRVQAELAFVEAERAVLESEMREMAQELRAEAEAQAREAREYAVEVQREAMEARDVALREALEASRTARDRGNDY